MMSIYRAQPVDVNHAAASAAKCTSSTASSGLLMIANRNAENYNLRNTGFTEQSEQILQQSSCQSDDTGCVICIVRNRFMISQGRQDSEIKRLTVT